jgi:glycosyltransferase involved in cell wall biosynthesis
MGADTSEPGVSVVVLTFNEAVNIERCLASVAWSNDVLVVDSGSTDGTGEMASGRGARVVTRRFDNFADQRNFALDAGNLRHEWVLHLDADETVSSELRMEIQEIVRGDTGMAGYFVPSRLMLGGKWLRHSGMYPSYQARFGRRDRLRFQMIGHGQREVLELGEMGTLRGHLLHFNFSKGMSDWIVKHARYARDEAAAIIAAPNDTRLSDLFRAATALERRRVWKGLSRRLPARPLAKFLYVYVLRLGFLDGLAGLRYAALMGLYEWLINANITEELERQRAR